MPAKYVYYNDCFEEERSYNNINSYYDDSISKIKPLKLICVFDCPEDADEFKAYVSKMDVFGNSYIGKSWSVGLEFNSIEGSKGAGIKFIKSYCEGIHTTIGVGDQENDIPLLRDADIGVAVGDAHKELFNYADLTVKPHYESAIEDLISILDKRL